MNDRELQSILAGLPSPAANEARTARALDRALVALRNRPGEEGRHRWWPALLATAAAACVIVAFLLHKHNDDSRVFAEMEHLFPGQLQAMIRHGSQTDLRLSATPEPASDQRVCITVSDGGNTTNILTYSGQEVCIPLKSGPLCLTPLITGNGNVLVVTGDNAFARSGRIHAATVRASLLTSS